MTDPTHIPILAADHACQRLGVTGEAARIAETLAVVGATESHAVTVAAKRLHMSRRVIVRRMQRAGVPSPQWWAIMGALATVAEAYTYGVPARAAIRGTRYSSDSEASHALHAKAGIRFTDLRHMDGPRWRYVTERMIEQSWVEPVERPQANGSEAP
jgi:hypothetical protein